MDAPEWIHKAKPAPSSEGSDIEQLRDPREILEIYRTEDGKILFKPDAETARNVVKDLSDMLRMPERRRKVDDYCMETVRKLARGEITLPDTLLQIQLDERWMEHERPAVAYLLGVYMMLTSMQAAALLLSTEEPSKPAWADGKLTREKGV